MLTSQTSPSRNAASTGGGNRTEYVWSLRYIDAPVLRDENQNADGDCTDTSGDERLFYLTDANMNVTCLVDSSGDAAERYIMIRTAGCGTSTKTRRMG